MSSRALWCRYSEQFATYCVPLLPLSVPQVSAFIKKQFPILLAKQQEQEDDNAAALAKTFVAMQVLAGAHRRGRQGGRRSAAGGRAVDSGPWFL